MALPKEIREIEVKPLKEESEWIQLIRFSFKEDGKPRVWDICSGKDSISVLMHDRSKKEMVFVRQFRPAVFLAQIRQLTKSTDYPDFLDNDDNRFPADLGYTLELCSGMQDMNLTAIDTAKAEMYQETGFDVPISSIHPICVVSTGAAANRQTVFYAEVDDSMRLGEGGGLLEENEKIEVVRMSVAESLKILNDESMLFKPASLCLALAWFKAEKLQKACSLCGESYTASRPKEALYRCGHCFCSVCIAGIKREACGPSEFKCPTCDAVFIDSLRVLDN